MRRGSDLKAAKAKDFNTPFLCRVEALRAFFFFGSLFGDRDRVQGRDVYADDAPVPLSAHHDAHSDFSPPRRYGGRTEYGFLRHFSGPSALHPRFPGCRSILKKYNTHSRCVQQLSVIWHHGHERRGHSPPCAKQDYTVSVSKAMNMSNLTGKILIF